VVSLNELLWGMGFSPFSADESNYLTQRGVHPRNFKLSHVCFTLRILSEPFLNFSGFISLSVYTLYQ